MTVAEGVGCPSRKDGVTRLGPATAKSLVLENRDPAGTEQVESSSTTGPRPVSRSSRLAVEVSSSTSSPSSGLSVSKITN